MSKFPGRLVRFYEQTLVRKTAAALSAPLLSESNHTFEALNSPVGTPARANVRANVRAFYRTGERVYKYYGYFVDDFSLR